MRRFQFEFGVSNQFALQTLDILDPTGVRVRSAVDYFVGHFISGGIGLADFWQVGFTLPVFSRTRFDDPILAVSPGPANISEIGDLRLVSKVRVLDGYRHRFGLAVEPFVTVPLNGDEHYLGESKVTAGGKVIGDVWITPRIKAAINAGAEFHTEDVLINNVDFNHRFLTGAGISAKLGRGISVSAEGQANTPFRHFFSDKDTTPVELLGGVRWAVGQTGLVVGAGGGSCIICGGRGAKARAFLNLAYRRPNESEEKEEFVPKPKSLTEKISYLRENCPADPKDFNPKIHDQECPKYFDLKQQAMALSQSDQEKFNEVIFQLKKDCPADPSLFNPEKHDADCPKYFTLKSQLVALEGGSTAIDLKQGGAELRFAQVLLKYKKNCPADPKDFNPETHDAGCPKYFEIRKSALALEERKKPASDTEATLRILKRQDQDRDGIPDAFDDCPADREDKNGVADGDGCPETGIRVTRNQIQTAAPVYFRFNSADLTAEARAILQTVAKTLRDNPSITRVEVAGYADSIGTKAVNRRISLARAKNVVSYLRKLGVPNSVALLPIGYGADETFAPNTTPEGRRENRRVLFRKSSK